MQLFCLKVIAYWKEWYKKSSPGTAWNPLWLIIFIIVSDMGLKKDRWCGAGILLYMRRTNYIQLRMGRERVQTLTLNLSLYGVYSGLLKS